MPTTPPSTIRATSRRARFAAMFHQRKHRQRVVAVPGSQRRPATLLVAPTAGLRERRGACSAGHLWKAPPANLAVALYNVQQALAGMIERFDLEKRYLRKDGRVVWVELHVSLLWNAGGTPRHFISQIVDITE